MSEAFIEDMIANPPELHFWGGKWHSGGFHETHVRTMMSHLANLGDATNFRIVETGAGQSTALFVALGFKEVVSIAPDEPLFERIRALLDKGGVKRGAMNSFADFSENALPGIAFKNVGKFDAALIDGGHGWPTVFVDFCYVNMMLRAGGLLMVDDVQLHTVQELFKLLTQQPGFELLEQRNKISFFRKLWDQPMLPDFGGQPYIAKHDVYPLVDTGLIDPSKAR